mmetsp:Transcript_3744/g.12125  ORF Transcript_3744/g.12125 Transcript_3744/m.12125 type:complete len:217 (-) Transcript_3744:24-674(-)
MGPDGVGGTDGGGPRSVESASSLSPWLACMSVRVKGRRSPVSRSPRASSSVEGGAGGGGWSMTSVKSAGVARDSGVAMPPSLDRAPRASGVQGSEGNSPSTALVNSSPVTEPPSSSPWSASSPWATLGSSCCGAVLAWTSPPAENAAAKADSGSDSDSASVEGGGREGEVAEVSSARLASAVCRRSINSPFSPLVSSPNSPRYNLNFLHVNLGTES